IAALALTKASAPWPRAAAGPVLITSASASAPAIAANRLSLGIIVLLLVRPCRHNFRRQSARVDCRGRGLPHASSLLDIIFWHAPVPVPSSPRFRAKAGMEGHQQHYPPSAALNPKFAAIAVTNFGFAVLV